MTIAAELLERRVDKWFAAWLADTWFAAQDDRGAGQLRAARAELALADDDLRQYNRREVRQALGAHWMAGLREATERYGHLERDVARLEDLLDVPEELAWITQPDDYMQARRNGETERCRLALARALDIVFVRRSLRHGGAAANEAAIAERTRIIAAPHGTTIDLPRSGTRFDFRPFPFTDEPETTAGIPLSEVG
jgi:hypothetical protein